MALSLAVAVLAGALQGAACVRLQQPYSITIPGRAVCAKTGGTCPGDLDMLSCAMRKNSTGIHAELKVMEVPPNGFVRTGLGPSFQRGVRYLLFDEDDVPDGLVGVKCTVQSAMACQAGPPSNVAAGTSSCGRPCVPDVRRPVLEYVRMQLGGTIAALATTTGSATPSRVAVVGVGAGSIPSWFLAAFPKVTVDAVDIDDGIIKVASDCFGLPTSDQRLRTHVEDGMQFFQSNQDSYDVIILDVVTLPKHFRLALPVLRQRLAAGGVLAVNGWRPDQEFQGLQQDVRSTFPRAWLAEDANRGNQILLAGVPGPRARSDMVPSAELPGMGAPQEVVAWSAEHPWQKLM